MDIECREENSSIKLVLKYKPSEFNSRQIEILKENGAEEMK